MSLLVEVLGHLLLAAVVVGGTFGLLELAGRAAKGSSAERGPAS